MSTLKDFNRANIHYSSTMLYKVIRQIIKMTNEKKYSIAVTFHDYD